MDLDECDMLFETNYKKENEEIISCHKILADKDNILYLKAEILELKYCFSTSDVYVQITNREGDICRIK